MSIAWSDVTKIAPELATVPAATQTAILADVSAQLTTGAFGVAARDDLAAKHLAAHLGALTQRSVMAESGGPFQAGPRALEQTIYGREYVRLCQACVLDRIGVT